MPKNAFKMKLKPGFEDEYKKRHNEIWPKLEQKIRNAGISNYSIFLDEETLTLFAIQELTESNTADNLTHMDIVKKWWKYMSDIMETNSDNSPVVKPLKEMFYMK